VGKTKMSETYSKGVITMGRMRLLTVDAEKIIESAPEGLDTEVEAFLHYIVDFFSHPNIVKQTEQIIPLQSRVGDAPRFALALTEISLRFIKALAHIARELEHVYPLILPKLASILENSANIIHNTCLQGIFDLEAILAALEAEKTQVVLGNDDREVEEGDEDEEGFGGGNNIH